MSASAVLASPSQLHARVARFATFWLATFACLLAFLAAMYSTYPETLPRRFSIVLPSTLLVFTALAVATAWVRRASFVSTKHLLAIDTALVLLASCDFGASVLMSADKVNNVYACFFWNSVMLTAHTIVVPASRRRVLWLAAAATFPLLAGTIGIAVDRPHFLPAPFPVVVVGAVLYAATTVAFMAWIQRSGLVYEMEELPKTSAPSAVSKWIARLHRPLTRTALQAIQFGAVKLAHTRRSQASRLRAYHAWDVLVAKRLSEEIDNGGSILDVGCGNGHRLHEIALFRSLKEARGIDVVPPASSQSDGVVQLSSFDGQHLPFLNKSMDVAMICYVLHHLHPAHAEHMLHEAIRVASRKVIVLEDSLPTWTMMYRLRNWAHRVDADLEYTGGSEAYKKTAGQKMFLTHSEWRSHLSALPGVREVSMESMHPPMKYRHHTMFILTLDESLTP